MKVCGTHVKSDQRNLISSTGVQYVYFDSVLSSIGHSFFSALGSIFRMMALGVSLAYKVEVGRCPAPVSFKEFTERT